MKTILLCIVAFAYSMFVESQTLEVFKDNSKGYVLTNITGVDMQKVDNKVNVLNAHAGRNSKYNNYSFAFKQLTPEQYQEQKPFSSFAFDAGFVAADGTINISDPVNAEQQAVFSNLTDVALYYLCQAYMYKFYETRDLPLLFKVGFGIFEAGLLPSDSNIKTAVNSYGNTLSSFDVLNNSATFITDNNKGVALAGAFGEFMNVFKNWGYPLIITINASGFDVAPWWFNVDNLAGLLGDFNRYIYARFLQPNENLRVKMYQETEHFKFYTRPVDATLNFPFFPNVSETAYAEYVRNFGVSHREKVSYYTLPECVDADLEGVACGGRVTGGTAWSSGMHSTCAATADQLPAFYGMCRHELGHSFQAIFPQGNVTAWLNEGFPSFCSDGEITDNKLVQLRQDAINCMNAATTYFGHRPTYEETRIYPSPDYGYYTLGYFLIDYQYRKGGFQLIKDIQMNDLSAYQSLGYPTAQTFLDDFYFYFDIRVLQKPIVTLLNPVANVDETNSTLIINWTPLKNDVKLNVSVSTDDKVNWTEIANHTTATTCTWKAGDIQTHFYVKISAPDNLDISTIFGPFTKGDLNKLNVTYPIENDYVITNDTVQIRWDATNIQSVKIEYSLNSGGNWTTIKSNYPTAEGVYKWVIPSVLSGNCQLKITDVANPSITSTGGTFKIVTNNNVGGPYLFDDNTIALFHFDNDLNNRSYLSDNASGNALNLNNENIATVDLGRSYKTDSQLTVPHSDNLNLTGDWTIEAWVKFNAFTDNTNMYLVNKPGNYALEVHPWLGNTLIGFYYYNLTSSAYAGDMVPLLNTWYHVAFVRSDDVIRVIVHDQNRQLISTSTANYPYIPVTSTQDLILGSGIDGYIDEVRISNVARTFINTGINEVAIGKSFSIYPNPASDKVTLNVEEDVTVNLYKSTGEQVETVQLGADKQIDVSRLCSGIYILEAKTAQGSVRQKLIIQH